MVVNNVHNILVWSCAHACMWPCIREKRLQNCWTLPLLLIVNLGQGTLYRHMSLRVRATTTPHIYWFRYYGYIGIYYCKKSILTRTAWNFRSFSTFTSVGILKILLSLNFRLVLTIVKLVSNQK